MFGIQDSNIEVSFESPIQFDEMISNLKNKYIFPFFENSRLSIKCQLDN